MYMRLYGRSDRDNTGGGNVPGKGTKELHKGAKESEKGAPVSKKEGRGQGRRKGHAKKLKRRPHSAPGRCRRHRRYGPPKKYMSLAEYSRKFWADIEKELAEMEERREKEEKEKEEMERVPEAEVEKLAVLTVKGLNLNIKNNAKEHHTAKFACVKGDDPQLVVRRGQEFTITVTFNRAYKKDKDDLIFVVEADKQCPEKGLSARFRMDEEGKGTYIEDMEWGARLVKMDPKTNSMEVSMYSPADCVIGEWGFSVWTAVEGEEGHFEYACDQPFTLLFNPWCPDDLVYLEECDGVDWLKEYVMNDSGSAYRGCARYISSKPWNYAQFDKGILRICMSILLKAFNFRMTPAMADPVQVARALSRIVNSTDDAGVLTGNWSGNYEGGTNPCDWQGSRKILKQYEQTGKPVRFGQCWVFSHLLTTVCRALGLPCRSVTCFDSAHDTDNNCVINYFYDQEGKKSPHLSSDSIWNFHVWNEVWILRPDLDDMGDYDGWHVIDATPQEQSYGSFQCGPSPVKAIKEGRINVGFDTAFVFSEVNADVKECIVDEFGDVLKVSSIRKNKVGHCLSTKPPDGKPHNKNLSYHQQNNPAFRFDLTDQYKHPEGSPEERQAVHRAVMYTGEGDSDYQATDLDVTLEMPTPAMVGGDMVAVAVVKNTTNKQKTLKHVDMSARPCTYFNHEESNQTVKSKRFESKTIEPGQQLKFELSVSYDECKEKCDGELNVYIYVCAHDEEDMPYSAQDPFRFLRPDPEFEGPEKCTAGDKITLKMSITNPLKVPLTDVCLEMEGQLDVAEGDQNNFEEFFWLNTIYPDDLAVGETRVLTILLQSYLEADDTEPEFRTQEFNINCKQLKGLGIQGSYSVEVHPKPSAPATS